MGLTICTPPSGPAQGVYREYVEADLGNLNLRRIILEGLQADDCFASKFIGLDANYGSCTGREVVEAIGRDASLATIEFKDPLLSAPPYQIDDPASIRESFKMLLIDASIHLTSAMLFSLRSETAPVTDDPFFETLLAMRLSDKKYVGETPVVAPLVGLEVIKSVIPDEVLEKLKPGDILDYREEAKAAHSAWSSEIARLAATLDDVPPTELGPRNSTPDRPRGFSPTGGVQTRNGSGSRQTIWRSDQVRDALEGTCYHSGRAELFFAPPSSFGVRYLIGRRFDLSSSHGGRRGSQP